ncbi:MAG: hypothetical protein ABI759_19130 [Candidatus Solibacter sp.]
MEVLKIDLQTMLNHKGGPCVSLYLPTHRAGPNTQQDPIRLKNLLREAESGLEDFGVGSSAIGRMLEPARRLLDDYNFWQHQSDGLAILAAPDFFRSYRLQMQVPELAVTSDRFHLKPLLAWIAATGHYYVLALTQRHVRVFEATVEGIAELEPSDLPQGLATAMRRRTQEHALQCHSVSAGPGRRSGTLHGHSGGDENKKEFIFADFQRVDTGMRELLARRSAPVVLAAVDYLRAIYQQANSNLELLGDGISGNPDILERRELHEKANAIVSAHLTKDQAKAADQYLRLWYTGRASKALEEILPAAHQGRVDYIFVAVGVQQWGRFDVSSNSTLLRDTPTAWDQDLLNLAALQTFATGGSVYAVAPEVVPGGGPVAAVFRY